ERMRKRPGLAAEIAQIFHPQANLFIYLPVYGFLEAFARFHKPRERGIARLRISRMARQQDAIAFSDQHHHGRRYARICGKPAGWAMKAQLRFGLAHPRSADAAIAMGAHPFRDLERPPRQRGLFAKLAPQRT